jgi:hypothetical protein
VSLKKPAEVREKVLRYMNVMSQPLVLLGARNINWTPLYATLVVSLNFEYRTVHIQEEKVVLFSSIIHEHHLLNFNHG